MVLTTSETSKTQFLSLLRDKNLLNITAIPSGDLSEAQSNVEFLKTTLGHTQHQWVKKV